MLSRSAWFDKLTMRKVVSLKNANSASHGALKVNNLPHGELVEPRTG
ncbi:hypothetical protein [Phyllobacterium sp. SB3]